MNKPSLLLILLISSVSLSACSYTKEASEQKLLVKESEVPIEKAPQVPALLVVDDEGSSKFDLSILEQAMSRNQKTPLSESELLGIKFLLEEEKMARDILSKSFERWSVISFDRVSSSEHSHISAVRALADKYAIDVSFYDNHLGEFTNAYLKEQYINLNSKGQASKEESLKTAVEIQEMLIGDLQKYMKETNNEDIKLVYENLLQASRNHLRYLVKNILRDAGAYEPRKLDKEAFESIVSMPNESGTFLVTQ